MTVSDGLARLIDPWSLTVTVDGGERTQHFPPLVDWLKAHIVPDTGKTMGGANDPSARSVLDVKSLDLLIHMQDVTRAWLQEWGVQSAGELKMDLRGFWDRLNTLHTSGVLDDTTFDHLAGYPDQWAATIWDLIEPPTSVAMYSLSCPECGEARVSNSLGEVSPTVTVEFRQGLEPSATCGACEKTWVGERGLVDLGRALGFEIDLARIAEAKVEEITPM